MLDGCSTERCAAGRGCHEAAAESASYSSAAAGPGATTATAADGGSQCMRDCCHLEGETPVEIRIAYQQPRPGSNLVAAAARRGVESPFESRFLFAPRGADDAAARAPPQGVRGAPPWPQGGLVDRRPSPPSGAGTSRSSPGRAFWDVARTASSTPRSQGGSDGFDPSVFVAPPDSDRGAYLARLVVGRAPPGVLGPPQEDDYFPEIVRAADCGGGGGEIHASSGRSSSVGGYAQRLFEEAWRSPRSAPAVDDGGGSSTQRSWLPEQIAPRGGAPADESAGVGGAGQAPVAAPGGGGRPTPRAVRGYLAV